MQFREKSYVTHYPSETRSVTPKIGDENPMRKNHDKKQQIRNNIFKLLLKI